jgi:predicted dehydrogenase
MSTPSPLNIGIVGLNFGRHIIDELQKKPASDYFKVGAVCDMNEAKAREFGDRLKVKAYTHLDQLLADPVISVVGLYTGPVKRAELLRKIIHAGKDVMTTKPFELDPVAARAVLEEAVALKRVIYLNSPSPLPAEWIQQVQVWHKKHDLGRAISCHSEAYCSYREKEDGSWYDNPELCPAAPVFRLGIYLINDLVRLFGGVGQVQVTISRIFTGRPTADNANLSLLFKNGSVGSIHANFCVDDGQYYANSFILHYERGTIYRNIRLTDYGAANVGSRMQLVAKTGERQNVLEECEISSMGDGYQWDVLHATLTGGKSVPIPIDDVVHGVQVIDAMRRAEVSRKMESV